MIRQFYTLLTFLIITISVNAQNLVPNPSFEEYQNIPCSWNVEPSDLSSYTNNWYSPANTSTDIHNILSDSACWSNPIGSPSSKSCRIGYQQPRTGNVIAGLYTVVNTHTWHEYLQVKLKEPLRTGQTYCVEMYVSPADYTSITSNNIGMLFTKEAINGTNLILGSPQINYYKVITDTKGWTLISGSFVATEDDEYLTIGNFYPDSQTDTQPLDVDGCSNGAYFYIDDVAVFFCPV